MGCQIVVLPKSKHHVLHQITRNLIRISVIVYVHTKGNVAERQKSVVERD